jgi:flagellar biosynthesis protein FlhB
MSTEVLTPPLSLSSSTSQIEKTFIDVVSDFQLELFSIYTLLNISHIIPGFIQETPVRSGCHMKVRFSENGMKSIASIRSFFDTLKKSVKITLAEVVHIFFLVERFIMKTEKEGGKGTPVHIDESNIGSLLLCGVLVGLKMDRDVPLKNEWFEKKFGITREILSESELSFLRKINFECVFPEDHYLKFYEFFLKQTFPSFSDSSSFVFDLPLLS